MKIRGTSIFLTLTPEPWLILAPGDDTQVSCLQESHRNISPSDSTISLPPVPNLISFWALATQYCFMRQWPASASSVRKEKYWYPFQQQCPQRLWVHIYLSRHFFHKPFWISSDPLTSGFIVFPGARWLGTTISGTLIGSPELFVSRFCSMSSRLWDLQLLQCPRSGAQ